MAPRRTLFAFVILLTVAIGWSNNETHAQPGYVPGAVRATKVSETKIVDLEPILLPDGTTFTPYLKEISVVVNTDDVRAERDRVLKEAEAGFAAEGRSKSDPSVKRRLDSIKSDFDQAIGNLSSENCGFLVVQRLPDVAVGRASHGSICSESDPVNTHFWGYTGQVYSGLQAAGWSSDYCGPYTQVPQYLWLEHPTGYGFYQNYSGWDSGTCTGTRNHVRLWDVYTNVGGGGPLHFSVGTAHRETWSWGDLTHHVVANGWFLGQQAIMNDHPAAGGYYYWGNWGWWGSGGYFDGWVGELGCYSPYGC